MNKFMNFMRDSVTSFHAIENIKNELLDNGFTRLNENELWHLEFGKKYFVVRNNTAVIAFTTPKEKTNYGINITSSHSDSPTFKIKPKNLFNDNHYLKLNTEVYGGPIVSTWLDRPLSFAGRVVLSEKGKVTSKLVYIDKDLLVIPNVAPHLMPEVNNGLKYNMQINMLPLFGLKEDNFTVESILAKELLVDASDIIDYDLFLVNRTRIKYLGYNENLVISPQLDDLASAYTSLQGFIKATNSKSINVYICYDNEEVGSRTRQGAGSDFLNLTLERLFNSLGYSMEEANIVKANSFMLSCDNAHAVNPNVGNVTDSLNNVYLNDGVVVKYNANQSYTTDSLSASYLKIIAKDNDLKLQEFTNRSDIRGGSTLGAILLGKYSIHSADIGLPQLAMHSATEVCGVKDIHDMVKLCKAFYDNSIVIEEDLNIKY